MWCYLVAELLKSFDVAKQIERLELPEVRALGPPKHRQQASIFTVTRMFSCHLLLLYHFPLVSPF